MAIYPTETGHDWQEWVLLVTKPLISNPVALIRTSQDLRDPVYAGWYPWSGPLPNLLEIYRRHKCREVSQDSAIVGFEYYPETGWIVPECSDHFTDYSVGYLGSRRGGSLRLRDYSLRSVWDRLLEEP